MDCVDTIGVIRENLPWNYIFAGGECVCAILGFFCWGRNPFVVSRDIYDCIYLPSDAGYNR